MTKQKNLPMATSPAAGLSCYMRRHAASKYLNISLGTLDNWINRGILPVFRPSRRVVLLRRGDVDAALEKFKQEAI